MAAVLMKPSGHEDVFYMPFCVLVACTGCRKENPFSIGEVPPGNEIVKTSGVTGANTLTISTDEEDLIDGTGFDRTIAIHFNEGGVADITGDANGIITVSGNQVTADNSATKEKVKYELSGSTSNGFLKVYSKNKQAIVLNDVSITNPHGAAINNQGKKRCFVVVNGNNSLSDGTSYIQTPDGEDEKAAFFSEGQLVFSGNGSLTVTAKGKAGITSDDYLHFMASPTVKVSSAAGHAVRGKDAVIVSDGVLEAIATQAMKKGVASDSLVLFNGGVLFALGGLKNGSVLSQNCYQASSWNRSCWYSLTVDGQTHCFKTPSGGGAVLVVSGPSQPTVRSDVTPSGGTVVFDGMAMLDGQASGGNAVSLTTYSGGSGMGSPGGGMGGPGGGWGW